MFAQPLSLCADITNYCITIITLISKTKTVFAFSTPCLMSWKRLRATVSRTGLVNIMYLFLGHFTDVNSISSPNLHTFISFLLVFMKVVNYRVKKVIIVFE